ncbi:MAG: peptidoglycan DD-metalloendopeptidase family protein [Chloroflexota bacterium]
MRRRSILAVTLIALVTAGMSIVTTTDRGPALAADPISEAKARQSELQATLAAQRQQLADLESAAHQLDVSLDVATAELADVSAEYDRVAGLLVQVRNQIAVIVDRIAQLRAQVAELDAQLTAVAADIDAQDRELGEREDLLQDHLRSAYEQSQTSLLEIILSADSFDTASAQVGYLMTISEQDEQLAADIRTMREELRIKRRTLTEGRLELTKARHAAQTEQENLEARQAELATMETRLAELKAAADKKRVQQAAVLNAMLAAQADVEESYAANTRAAQAQEALVQQLVAAEAERQRQVEEARRREAERRAQEQLQQQNANATSANGFRWPEAATQITQEWGPTSFGLEPSYTYGGTNYAHFHAGLDMSGGCGTPILAAKEGVVAASGQPLAPFDSGYGVVVDHGGGTLTWYWHISPQVVVYPGQIVLSGQVIGYEASTGFSTGCHLHFAVNDRGTWENPRNYLP